MNKVTDPGVSVYKITDLGVSVYKITRELTLV